MNVEKPKVIGISKKPSTVQIMISEKQLENVDVCKCLGIVITNYARSPPTGRVFVKFDVLVFRKSVENIEFN
jgi:hypothetical protein